MLPKSLLHAAPASSVVPRPRCGQSDRVEKSLVNCEGDRGGTVSLAQASVSGKHASKKRADSDDREVQGCAGPCPAASGAVAGLTSNAHDDESSEQQQRKAGRQASRDEVESHLQCDYHRPFLAQQQPEKEQQPAAATGRCSPLHSPGLLPPSIAVTATTTVRPSSSPIAPNRVAVVDGQPRYPRLRNRFLRSTFRLVLFRCLACPVLSCRANPTLSYLILSCLV